MLTSLPGQTSRSRAARQESKCRARTRKDGGQEATTLSKLGNCRVRRGTAQAPGRPIGRADVSSGGSRVERRRPHPGWTIQLCPLLSVQNIHTHRKRSSQRPLEREEGPRSRRGSVAAHADRSPSNHVQPFHPLQIDATDTQDGGAACCCTTQLPVLPHDRILQAHLGLSRASCCIVPAVTPDGEDTPKWSATVAARMEDEELIGQPDFGSQKSPESSSKRARTPSSYASSSFSPSEDPAAAAFFGRKRTRIIYGQNPANYTPGGTRKPKK